MNQDLQDSGANLIFLISQPRAGSTLLQRILENHPDIHTAPETWMMLHSLYALRNKGHESEYNSEWSGMATRDFLKTLPEGENHYYEGVRKMHSHLYQLALSPSGKKYFLDKTPRYFYIIPELYRTFPNAKFIILLRNPLAVLCSMITTWIKHKEHWSVIGSFQPDLVLAPSRLLEAKQLVPSSRCLYVYYESLLSNSEETVQQICNHLEISYSPELLTYGRQQKEGFGYNEQTKTVHDAGRPKSTNISKWVEELEDPQSWQLVNDYLELLGEDTLEKMGYSYLELKQIVTEHQPSHYKSIRTVPLKWLLKKPSGFRILPYYLLRLDRSLQRTNIGDIFSKLKTILNT